MGCSCFTVVVGGLVRPATLKTYQFGIRCATISMRGFIHGFHLLIVRSGDWPPRIFLPLIRHRLENPSERLALVIEALVSVDWSYPHGLSYMALVEQRDDLAHGLSLGKEHRADGLVPELYPVIIQALEPAEGGVFLASDDSAQTVPRWLEHSGGGKPSADRPPIGPGCGRGVGWLQPTLQPISPLRLLEHIVGHASLTN